jgi:ribonuclease Z
MPKLMFLGTAAAVADEKHENTHLAIVTDKRLLLIDCPGNPVVRMKQMGIDLTHRLTDLLLTHFHPDHVSGFPLLIQTLWLLGRNEPLHIYGLDFTIHQAHRLINLYDWETWTDLFPLIYHNIPEEERFMALDGEDLRLYTSPASHYLPTLATRVELLSGQYSLAYSCDTRPFPAVTRLAEGVDTLIHEATGAHTGHSSAGQAGEVAREAGAKSLYLIHYPVWENDPTPLIAEAKSEFDGEVHLAQDYEIIDIQAKV